MKLPILDDPSVAVVGAWAMLDIPVLGDDGLIELASRLTVSAILLLGLYFLNKMKESETAKREEALKSLMDNAEKAHQQVRNVYDARLADKDKRIEALEHERKELQSKIIDG